MSSAPVVSVRAVSKEYPGVRALQDVSFDVYPGTVHALVGENGAGKSTLIKVIAGTSAPSRGEIVIDGQSYPSLTPGAARALGVRLVPQERHVCGDLSVMENVLLGRMPKRMRGIGPLDRRAAYRMARATLDDIELDIDCRTPMRDLTVAETQAVEIARALSAKARLVIMDEPTAALTASDVHVLFRVIRRLCDQGVAFLYVSHHLEEIFELGDELTVLRDGRHIVTRPVAGLEMDELISLVIGRSPDQMEFGAGAAEPGATVLQIRDVRRPPALDGVSFDVRAGEVLALTGGIGSGRSELARSLVGVTRPESGSIVMPGLGTVKSPTHAVRNGIAFLPEDRKNEGVLGTRDIIDNVDVGWLGRSRALVDRPGRRRRDAVAQVQSLRVKTPHVFQHAGLLSGGNQQKVLLGRWLNVGVRVLILDGPTEGIDIGSRLEIYGLLRRLAEDGVAVVIFTSDLEEARLVADRAIVLRRGRIAGELSAADISEERLLALEYGTNLEGAASR
jgi:ABC-type sugar transport system ATPase subunit